MCNPSNFKMCQAKKSAFRVGMQLNKKWPCINKFIFSHELLAEFREFVGVSSIKGR